MVDSWYIIDVNQYFLRKHHDAIEDIYDLIGKRCDMKDKVFDFSQKHYDLIGDFYDF